MDKVTVIGVFTAMSLETTEKLDKLSNRTGIKNNDLVRLLTDIGNWIAEEKTKGGNPTIVAITTERRETMPQFDGIGQLRFN